MEKISVYVGKVVLFAILMALPTLFEAWIVMLALGVAAHQWSAVPAFGYGATFLLVYAWNILFSRFVPKNKEN